MSTHKQLFIDGEWQPASSGSTFVTIDPSTEEPICEVARGAAADVDRAVNAARRAMHGPWRDLTPAMRGARLLRLADLVEADADALARLETLDVGKPLKESRGDIGGVVATLRYNAGAADKMQGDTIPLGDAFVDLTLLEPIGVTGHIVPWNFPLGMAMRSLAPALAAGCTTVLKPAEQTPLSALRLAELSGEAGFPDGVLNVVPGFGEEAGEALVEHPLVNGITFTGSVATGRRVAVRAAQSFKSVVLELGGKNPMLVFADADVERALDSALEGGFENAGQVCSSVSRLILHRSLKSDFIEALRERTGRLRIGPGADDPDIGPLVSQAQHDKVMHHIAQARDGGANIRFGGNRPSDLTRGYFVEPTLLDEVSAHASVACEETFGPVMVVAAFDTEDEALALANALDYGLVAGVHTRDISRALRLARQLESGSVWINGWFIGGVQAPTGGVKNSGVGRERGLIGISNYLSVKNVGIKL